MACEWFVKDGINEGVDWCAYSDNPWNCPYNIGVPSQEECGKIEENPKEVEG